MASVTITPSVSLLGSVPFVKLKRKYLVWLSVRASVTVLRLLLIATVFVTGVQADDRTPVLDSSVKPVDGSGQEMTTEPAAPYAMPSAGRATRIDGVYVTDGPVFDETPLEEPAH